MDIGSRYEINVQKGEELLLDHVHERKGCWGNDVGILCKMKGGRHAVRRHVDWQSRSIRKH